MNEPIFSVLTGKGETLSFSGTFGRRYGVTTNLTFTYNLSGIGNSSDPVIVDIQGGYNSDIDYRMWLLVNNTGTLNWNINANGTEPCCDGSFMWITRPSIGGRTPFFHTLNQELIAYDFDGNYTEQRIAGPVRGQTQSGSYAVTAGDYIVISYTKDDGSESGPTDRIIGSFYIV